MKRAICLSLLAFLIISFSGCAYKAQPLYNPAPVPIPKTFSKSETPSKIRAALFRRGWNIDREAPGEIFASISRSRHTARIKISYDNKNARVEYLDSENLNYSVKDGEQRIHSRYNIWLRNVEHDLRQALYPYSVG